MEKQVQANYKYRKSLREDRKAIGKLKQFKANQKKYNKCYKKKSWNEAKEDPALHQAMMCQQRLKRQKSRLKEKLEHGQLTNEKRQEMVTAFDKISDELKQLTPQIQQLRTNLRQANACDACKHTNIYTEHMYVFHMPANESEVNMNESSHLINGFTCSNCNRIGSTVRTEATTIAPPYLLIAVNRIKMTGTNKLQKFFAPCTYAESITIKENGYDIQYKLSAVTLHLYNRIKKGHYKTYIKYKNQWLLIDDDQVKEGILLKQVLRHPKVVYPVAYQRINNL